ncbi:hypothetical protein ACFL1M_04900 [Patescibacteria group bacterium]
MSKIDDSTRFDEVDEKNKQDAAESFQPSTNDDPSSDVVDIDEAVKEVYGNKPKPGEPWTMGDEVEKDEKDRRGI